MTCNGVDRNYQCSGCHIDYPIEKLVSKQDFVTMCKTCNVIICQIGRCLRPHVNNTSCALISIPKEQFLQGVRT